MLVGTASVGPDHPESELAARRGRQGDPGELFIIDQLEVGMQRFDDDVSSITFDESNGPLYPFSLAEKVGQDHRAAPVVHARRRRRRRRGGGPIVPFEMLSVLTNKAGRGLPVRGPSLGLFLDLEVRLLDGPVFVDEPYEIHREVVGLSQSRRTESYWTESTITEQRSGKAVADRAAAPGRVQGVLRRLPARAPRFVSVPAMDGEIIASGLEFPEGPVWVDGTLYFTEIVGGAISRWTADGGVERVADDRWRAERRGRSARDGVLYVTQNGGMTPDGADHGRHPTRHAGR